MGLGLKRNEVRLVSHDATWGKLFQETKKDLVENTEFKEHQIEHIGSTAIKNIQAKPILDMLVGVQSLDRDLTPLENELRSCGFYRLKVEKENEVVFAKFTDKTFEVKTQYIHLTPYQGELWNNLIYFRDYLNENEAARKEYEQLKVGFSSKQNEGIEAYTDMKETFVKAVLATREKDA